MEQKRIDCLKCRHYYVTWDAKFPKGCRAFGFKTNQLPSLAVFRSSGSPCMKFEKKASTKEPAQKGYYI
ncbi:hypothetical protein LC085_10590 [Bacillus tianshenii]|uniref:hypothetical protein n=1 Tax=Sutcliffiella tianshenii TaxID=1463404 RepID=UPI00195C515B|nr:hypothetical protein [Bacillus tianshenii]MCA1320356.1 hypothetical protein [Bacillus tianshenii]